MITTLRPRRGEQGRSVPGVSRRPGSLGILLLHTPGAQAGHDLGRARAEHSQVLPVRNAPTGGQHHCPVNLHLQVGSAAFRRPFARAGHHIPARAV
jgi:hypothetical protein